MKLCGLLILSFIVFFLTREFYSDYILIAFLVLDFVIVFFPKYFLGVYFLFLSCILLFRGYEINSIARGEYIFSWMKIIFTNKIVFVNVIGNIVLFIPLGFDLRKMSIGFLFIVLIEIMQMIFRIGVFDVIDIILNGIGLIIGRYGRIIYGRKKEKR